MVIEGRKSRGRTYSVKDMVGFRSGKLTVISFSHSEGRPNYNSVWKCKCDCGNESLVRIGALNSTRIRSCGCVNFEKDYRVKHPLHRVWIGIKQRCLNPQNTGYKRYGYRGISLYEKWSENYITFYEDVIGLYVEGHQIDRINNDGNYEPGNIRWVTPKTNMRNSSNTILTEQKVFEIRRSKLTHKELAKMYGVAKQTISSIRSKKSNQWSDVW